MKTRHTLALASGAASALALVPAVQAQAHDATSRTVGRPTVVAPHASYRALLANLGTLPLDRLDAWATKLQTAAAAVPDGTVLTGSARQVAKRQLVAALVTSKRLGALDGLSAAQQAKVDVITTRLTAAVASLRALLGNQAPAAIPVTVVPTSTTKTVSATDTRHVCDHDGSRFGGSRDASFGDGSRHWGGRHHR